MHEHVHIGTPTLKVNKQTSCYGMNCVPPKGVEVLTPVPGSVTFFGKKVFEKVFADDELKMRSFRAGPNPVRRCPNERGIGHRHRHTQEKAATDEPAAAGTYKRFCSQPPDQPAHRCSKAGIWRPQP